MISIEILEALKADLVRRGAGEKRLLVIDLAMIGLAVTQAGNEDLESHIVRWVAREHMLGFRAGHYYRGEKCKCGSTNTR